MVIVKIVKLDAIKMSIMSMVLNMTNLMKMMMMILREMVIHIKVQECHDNQKIFKIELLVDTHYMVGSFRNNLTIKFTVTEEYNFR